MTTPKNLAPSPTFFDFFASDIHNPLTEPFLASSESRMRAVLKGTEKDVEGFRSRVISQRGGQIEDVKDTGYAHRW